MQLTSSLEGSREWGLGIVTSCVRLGAGVRVAADGLGSTTTGSEGTAAAANHGKIQ